ncbi:hypothetical protein BHM03_00010581 [Ensete ventricosum]|nr:hypothetical protein BHM03_00010581 [Ensete ventricosum]
MLVENQGMRFATTVSLHRWNLFGRVSQRWLSYLSTLERIACKPLLGSRELISMETEVNQDGRSFEKLHLGNYRWISYGEAFKAVCNIASGLLQLGIGKNDRIAIFCETRAEWLLALQVDVLVMQAEQLMNILILGILPGGFNYGK